MAIIYSYPLNDDIKPLDELVGTTEKNINGQLKTVTRNFLLQDLAEFFIVDGGLQKTIILTTANTDGAATLNQLTGVLNIPRYDQNGFIKLTSLSSIATGLTYDNTTGVFSLSVGYSIPTTASQTNWDTAYNYRLASLTTTGTSGPATLAGNVLNIPDYSEGIVDSPITIVNGNSLFSTGLVGTGINATGAYSSVFLGEEAGANAIEAYDSNFIGGYAGEDATNANESNFFGYGAGSGATSASRSNFFGSNAGGAATTAKDSNFFGYGAGEDATNANESNFFGSQAGKQAANANNSNFLGYHAGNIAINASSSNFFGFSAGREATYAGSSNFFGFQAGNNATSASNSNFFGSNSGNGATDAYGSNFFGYQTGNGAINASYSNLLGYQVGLNFTDNNIGSNNIIIGTNISLPDAAVNSINLGGVLFGTGTYSTVSGDPSIAPTSGGKIGIGVVEPTNTLHIYSEAEDTSGLRLERLTSSSPTSAGQAIGVDASGNIVTVTGGGGSQDLQSVTDIGATTTNPITVTVTNNNLVALNVTASGTASTGISSNSDYIGVKGISAEGTAIEGSAYTGIGVYGSSYSGVGASVFSYLGKGIEVYGNGSATPSVEVNLGNSNKGLVINSGTSSTGNPIVIDKNGVEKLTVNQEGELSIVKIPGGLSIEYLMADGTTTTGGTGGGSIPHATASGTDTYTATVSGVTSYADGDAYLIRFTIGNTTVATLNINALGAIPLYRNNDGPLIGGDVQANGEMLCVYNSTANTFQCIGTSPNSIISYVTNAGTVTITKGQVVYAFGGTGDRMTVKLASNVGDSTSAQTVGIVLSTSIAANQKGFIIFQGLLDNLSILPTDTWADGDPVYLGSTAGSITKVKPYAPNHLVYIGIVTTASNGGAGRMYVRVQNGYELDELHNVQAQTPTLKDTLYYDNTVSPAQWKTSSISSILGYTPANDASVVHITGNETISGLKTFTSDLTATKYLYSGGSIFPEFGQTFYINGTGATHSFGGGISNIQNNLDVPNGTFKIGLQTASTIASFDANKNVVSLTTANGYPTLTELKSLVGISTTAIQTQLNSKQASSSILSGLSALSFSGGTPFIRMISGSVFTLDTANYLTSVGIYDLTATGTPSATTYLRGDNTWSSIPVPSQSAYTMLANNTASSAVPTEQAFENLTNQAYSGTIVWGPGAAPSTNPQHTYSLSQVGNLVTLTINLSYGAAGAGTLTSVACELPSTAPLPALPTSVSAALDIINYGTGVITTSKNLPSTNLPYCALRIKSVGTPNVYEVVVTRGAAAYRYAYATIQYFV